MKPWLLFVALCSISTGYFIGSSIQTFPTNKVDQSEQYYVVEVNRDTFFSQSCIYLILLNIQITKIIPACIYLSLSNFQITKIYSGSSTCYIVKSELVSSGQESKTTNNTSVGSELSSYFWFI